MAGVQDVLASLRAMRLEQNLSQNDIAQRIGTTQSAIARLESGIGDPRLSTVRRYARALGAGLDLRERPPTASLENTADGIRETLAQGCPGDAFRQVIQFVNDTERVTTNQLQAVLRIEPTSSEDGRWDAFLAGIAEYLARRRNIPTPGWASAPSRFLDRFWFVIEDILGRQTPGLAVAAFVASPPELASRGVFVDRSSLVSV